MYGITGATIIGPSRAMPPVGAVDRNPLGVEKSGLYKIFKSITIWIIFYGNYMDGSTHYFFTSGFIFTF